MAIHLTTELIRPACSVCWDSGQASTDSEEIIKATYIGNCLCRWRFPSNKQQYNHGGGSQHPSSGGCPCWGMQGRGKGWLWWTQGGSFYSVPTLVEWTCEPGLPKLVVFCGKLESWLSIRNLLICESESVHCSVIADSLHSLSMWWIKDEWMNGLQSCVGSPEVDD